MDWKELLFNEIKDLRDESQEHSKEVGERLSAIESDLKYHIKRTDLLESEVKPIKDHVNGIQYTGKVVAWIAGIVITCGSIVGAVTKIKGWW